MVRMSRLHSFVLSLASAIALVGCNAQHPGEIPGAARVLSEGNHATATTEDGGTAYVYDQTAHKMLWSGSVGPGQDVSADPAGGAVTVDGTPVANGSMEPNHHYQIWFNPAGAGK